MDCAQKLRRKALAKKASDLTKLQDARKKTAPVMQRFFNNELSPEAAGEKFKQLIPDEKLRRLTFDFWQKVFKAKPERITKDTKNITRKEIELEKQSQFLKMQQSFQSTLNTLTASIEKDDVEAAKALAKLAFQATFCLENVEKKKPELFCNIAKATQFWPVLAKDEPNWEKETAQRVKNLNLGAEARMFKTAFRNARGTEANLPARRWAKAAVRTIEETVLRILSYGAVIRDFESPGKLADFCIETGWQIGGQPAWVRDVIGLKKFSQGSLSAWKSVVRKMIREQMPDFHTRAEWSNQRNTAVASGRTTPGEIQNAILDDITSALGRLVPDLEMPKLPC
ncbi:MAG: hypothetical protein P4N60_21390 [Verrucomicrobiae bacterium]|nr:hypothetical protein [Verrucomicrobiae bacterium]